MGKSYYKSPIGILEIICENSKLVSLKLVDYYEKSNVETGFIKDIKFQLDEYFSEKRTIFNIKINPAGNDFQKLVWKELQNIPYGKTKSYSEVAMSCNNKKAQRAVGFACNKNPIMIIVPCHRVILKSGNIGGFAYGNEIKLKLLGIENCVEMIQKQ